jgi:hypothetical protein
MLILMLQILEDENTLSTYKVPKPTPTKLLQLHSGAIHTPTTLLQRRF